MQENIVRLLFCFLEFADSVTRAADVALIANGSLGERIVDMYAAQAILLFSIEVAVNGDTAVIVVAKQSQ